MDPEAKALESIEVYDDLRTAYLERRSLRCGTPQGDR
jgi:hypothetical protein